VRQTQPTSFTNGISQTRIILYFKPISQIVLKLMINSGKYIIHTASLNRPHFLIQGSRSPQVHPQIFRQLHKRAQRTSRRQLGSWNCKKYIHIRRQTALPILGPKAEQPWGESASKRVIPTLHRMFECSGPRGITGF